MDCFKLITVRDKKGNAHRVPCGKCAFCLTNKRSQWMFRIHFEMRKQMNPGYFLTFTYDEKHVKRVANGRLSLRFRDVQLYLKRLRKAKYYAKYICVGEYGSITNRPHYHMLLWTDASPEFLQENWKSSKDNTVLGIVHFGSLTMQSAMYTLKYIIQPKQKIDGELEKTRAQFSRGLGLEYLTTAMYDYHTEDYENPVLFGIVDGRKVALPRYYKSKIFTKYQMRLEAEKTVWLSREKHCEKLSELLMLGMRPRQAVDYMQLIRAEQARRIISKTKFNQTL